VASSVILARHRTIAGPRVPLRRQRHRLVQIVANGLLLIEIRRLRTVEVAASAAPCSSGEVFRNIVRYRCLLNDSSRAVDDPDDRLRRYRSGPVIVAATISRRQSKRLCRLCEYLRLPANSS